MACTLEPLAKFAAFNGNCNKVHPDITSLFHLEGNFYKTARPEQLESFKSRLEFIFRAANANNHALPLYDIKTGFVRTGFEGYYPRGPSFLRSRLLSHEDEVFLWKPLKDEIALPDVPDLDLSRPWGIKIIIASWKHKVEKPVHLLEVYAAEQ